MKLRWQGFHGPIAAPIERYLTLKRALGCRFRTEERALQLLDRFSHRARNQNDRRNRARIDRGFSRLTTSTAAEKL
jgi:hypothetical protein